MYENDDRPRPTRPSKRVSFTAVVGVLALAGLAAWHAVRVRVSLKAPIADDAGHSGSSQPHRLVKPTPADNRFVGSQACARCHAEIWTRYQSHPMSRSLARVAAAMPLENMAETTFSPNQRQTYRVERRGGTMVHHEIMADRAGATIYDLAVEVGFVVGSGRHGRSYLIDRDGLMFVSPVSWYAQADRWDLTPGHRATGPRRFETRVGDGCLGCHAGRLTESPDRHDQYPLPRFFEEAIGCERCHGPGGRHIADASLAGRVSVHESIVNPARLDANRRESVCNQCHLKGESHILRYGKTDLDFRPGDRLEDVWTVFVAGAGIGPDGKTHAVNQVEQMRASRCYAASGDTLGCTSCHDPHSSPAPEDRAQFYAQRCLACHADRGCTLPSAERAEPPASNSCVHCHMPRLATSNVAHTAHTDHRVIRRPMLDLAARPMAGLVAFDAADERLSHIERDRARGLLLFERLAFDRGARAAEIERLLTPVVEAAPDDTAVWEALGAVRQYRRPPENPVPFWQAALRADSNRESVLQRLAVYYQEGNAPAAALVEVERYLKLNPWDAEFRGRQALLLRQLGKLDEAIAAAKQGLEVDPAHVGLHSFLADAYAIKDDMRASQQQRDFVERLTGDCRGQRDLTTIGGHVGRSRRLAGDCARIAFATNRC